MEQISVIDLLYQQKDQDMIYNALPRTLRPGYFFGPHCHENVEVCLMREGSCDIAVNGETTTVRKGDLMVIFSHMIHTFHVNSSRPADFLQLHFRPAAFLNVGEAAGQNMKFIRYMIDHRSAYLFQPYTPQLLSCVERICEEIGNESEAYHTALANIYIDEMVFLLSREIEQSFRRVFSIENPIAIKAIQYINENMEGRFALEDVALACGVSTRYLSHIFRHYVNFTINDYINIAKVDRGIRYILDTSLSIGEVASKLGFSSAQYFSTVFKKYTGMTPREFKARENRDI